MLAIAFVCGGATCARRQTLKEFTPPVVFAAQPELSDIMQQVNRSLTLKSLESNTLTITSPEISTKLRGNLQWERNDNFNLQAYPGSRLMGVVFAAGSNSEMFWLQTQMPSPPTLYYAYHDEFNSQPGPRRILPVSPLWLREAMGVVELDPALMHEGPVARVDGMLEVRSYIPTPRGSYRRHIILHPENGTIQQTLLYDHLGKLVANAQQSEHQYYSAIDSSLPHKVAIQLMPDDGPVLAFTVEVGFYLINEASGAESGAFTPPDTTGLRPPINLVEANRDAGQLTPPTAVYTESQPRSNDVLLLNQQRPSLFR